MPRSNCPATAKRNADGINMSIQTAADIIFHLPPQASEVLQNREFGACTMRIVHAGTGPLRTKIPPLHHRRLRCSRQRTPAVQWTPVMSPSQQKGAHSVCWPNDEALGSLTHDTVYSCLHLDNDFVSQVPQREAAKEAIQLARPLRGAPAIV